MKKMNVSYSFDVSYGNTLVTLIEMNFVEPCHKININTALFLNSVLTA